MAYFAKLGPGAIVEQVIIVDNFDMVENGQLSEEKGKQFCVSMFGGKTYEWVQTWETGNRRKAFAGPGYKYDPINDWFVPPQPNSSWTWDEELWDWIPG